MLDRDGKYEFSQRLRISSFLTVPAVRAPKDMHAVVPLSESLFLLANKRLPQFQQPLQA
jgi:hypothetical protein